MVPATFNNRRYFSFSNFLRRRFGAKVYRVTVDAGFTCPNVDGTVAVGGCVYCDNRSFSPNRRLPRVSIRKQVERGIDLLSNRYGVDRFLAYFQAATNTYAPADRLRRLYDEALDHPQIVGLAIGTRPEFGDKTRSTDRTRSCLPPLTTSPACTKTRSAETFSMESWLTSPVS